MKVLIKGRNTERGKAEYKGSVRLVSSSVGHARACHKGLCHANKCYANTHTHAHKPASGKREIQRLWEGTGKKMKHQSEKG